MILAFRICFRAFDVCVPDDVLVEEEQNNSLPSLMTPSITSGMSSSMDMPRKRKGSTDNQLVLLIHLISLKYTEKKNPAKLCVYSPLRDSKLAMISDADMEDDQNRCFAHF